MTYTPRGALGDFCCEDLGGSCSPAAAEAEPTEPAEPAEPAPSEEEEEECRERGKAALGVLDVCGPVLLGGGEVSHSALPRGIACLEPDVDSSPESKQSSFSSNGQASAMWACVLDFVKNQLLPTLPTFASQDVFVAVCDDCGAWALGA